MPTATQPFFSAERSRENFGSAMSNAQQRGVLASVADQIPEQTVERYLAQVRTGNCPRCKGGGPVDVHISYRVWSALVLTSWSSRPAVCCQSCGTKRRVGDTVFSLLLGWWGFPWGLLVTPVQVGRNVVGFFRSPNLSAPSPALEKVLRLQLAANAVQAQQPQQQQPGM